MIIYYINLILYINVEKKGEVFKTFYIDHTNFYFNNLLHFMRKTKLCSSKFSLQIERKVIVIDPFGIQ